jgi:hypothetical protein
MSRNANQSERTGRGKAGLLIVYVVFADTQRRGCARGTQAGPLERFVKACRQCPSQAVVLDAPLKVVAGGILLHHIDTSQYYRF